LHLAPPRRCDRDRCRYRYRSLMVATLHRTVRWPAEQSLHGLSVRARHGPAARGKAIVRGNSASPSPSASLLRPHACRPSAPPASPLKASAPAWQHVQVPVPVPARLGVGRHMMMRPCPPSSALFQNPRRKRLTRAHCASSHVRRPDSRKPRCPSASMLASAGLCGPVVTRCDRIPAGCDISLDARGTPRHLSPQNYAPVCYITIPLCQHPASYRRRFARHVMQPARVGFCASRKRSTLSAAFLFPFSLDPTAPAWASRTCERTWSCLFGSLARRRCCPALDPGC
jgi:hypothetical protein